MFGVQYLPEFGDYCVEHMHIDLDKQDPPQDDMEIAPPILNHAFCRSQAPTSYPGARS